MNLNNLKEWFDKSVKIKGKAFWVMYRTETGNKPIMVNYTYEDAIQSWSLLEDYIYGQVAEGQSRFSVNLKSDPKDSNPFIWNIGGGNLGMNAEIAGANRMGVMAQSPNNEILTELKALREDNNRIAKQFDEYKLRNEFERKLSKKDDKIAELEAKVSEIKKKKTGVIEGIVEHETYGPMLIGGICQKLGLPMGNAIAIAGAKRGAVVPAAIAESDNDEFLQNDKSDNEHDSGTLTDEQNTVLDALQILQEEGISDAHVLLFGFSQYFLQNRAFAEPFIRGEIKKLGITQ